MHKKTQLDANGLPVLNDYGSHRHECMTRRFPVHQDMTTAAKPASGAHAPAAMPAPAAAPRRSDR